MDDHAQDHGQEQEMFLEEFLDHQRAVVAEHGWGMIGTEASVMSSLPLTYTVGFTDHGAPELVMTGLRPAVAGTIAAGIWEGTVKQGEELPLGPNPNLFGKGYTAWVVDVDPSLVEAHVAVAMYGREKVRAQLIVFPDESGYFPWEENCDHHIKLVQPFAPRSKPHIDPLEAN